MIDNALQVTAVIIKFVGAIKEAARLRRIVICQIAIAEAIDHYQVDDVVGRETLEASGTRHWFQDCERGISRSVRVSDLQTTCARLCLRSKQQINENVGASLVDPGGTG